MRIAIVTSNRNIIGGVETYLRRLLPALAVRGHSVALWHEEAETANREMIELPEGAPSWSVAQLGAERALDSLRQWQPNLIYAHGLLSPMLEGKTQRIAPAVFFAHSYYGSCISGRKSHTFPVVRPCDLRFGWQCLLHYYPNRCGGINPRTMLSDYERQTKRLELLRDYKAIIVASSHMLREYERYGLADRLHLVRLPVSSNGDPEPTRNDRQPGEKWRILFLGRLELLKGARVLLDALPAATRELGVPLHVTFAGEGDLRKDLEQRAFRLASANPLVTFSFTDWLSETQRDAALRDSDLLIMPTLLPEPFGLTGLEAGLYGVPVVAFAVGGIPDWLKEGINGVLAPGNPPRATNLAAAIVRCLSDSAFYANLRRGAKMQAQHFSMETHLADLIPVLESAAFIDRTKINKEGTTIVQKRLG